MYAMGLSMCVVMLLGEGSLQLWRYTPELWLCEHGELPGDKEKYPRGRERWSRSGFYLIALLLELSRLAGNLQVPIWVYGILSLLFTQVALADFLFQIIPDQWIALIGLLCMGQSLWKGVLVRHGVESLAAVLCMTAIAMIGYWYKGTDLVGFGDIKLLLVCGLYGGGSAIFAVAVVGFFSCGICCGIGVLLKRVGLQDTCPLGPYLIMGWWLRFFWG